MQIYKCPMRIKRVHHKPGEIVTGRIYEYGKAKAKRRPVIIVAVGNCCHRVIGLTTQRQAKRSDYYRVPVLLPLDTPQVSYLWGGGLQSLSRLDVGKHLGWLDEDGLVKILKTVDLPKSLRQTFQLSVYESITRPKHLRL